MRKFLLDEVNKVGDKISFGMPGHKGKQFFDLDVKKDLTEILSTDNLLNPKGAILKLENQIRDIYGSKDSFLIINGSTGALHIAISIATKNGDNILVERQCHKSVYNALILNDLNPIYLEPVYDKKRALFFGIEKEELIKKIRNNDIKACVLTSPNFYGGILKLKELIEILHSEGITVIVDEAHGAHLYFTDLKKYSAIEAGADLVINSTHKTIPSLTQTALLHLNSDKFTRREVLDHINLYHTTSPSYLLMLSIEAGIDYMDERGRIEILNRTKDLDSLKSEIDYSLDLKHDTICANDPLKFLFRVRGLEGEELLKKFLYDENIRLEMADLYYALAIISPINSSEEIAALRDAIINLSRGSYRDIKPIDFFLPKKLMSPREAFESETEIIDFRKSKGRISKNIVAAYPPGVPLISFGEVFSDDIIANILEFKKAGIEVVGMKDDTVEVVKWVFL